MNKAIEAIVFDFGNVLARVDRMKICSSLSRHSPYSPRQICSRIFGNELESDSETGKYDSREHFLRIKRAIQGDAQWNYDQFRHEFKDGFDLNPEGLEALKTASEHMRVFVLSNTSYLHALWLFEQEELATIPEYHVFSFKVGAMKPDARIWEALLSVSSLEANQCVYIDDIKEYCDAAEALGYNSIHYQMGSTPLMEELSKWFAKSVPDGAEKKF